MPSDFSAVQQVERPNWNKKIHLALYIITPFNSLSFLKITNESSVIVSHFPIFKLSTDKTDPFQPGYIAD